MDIKEEEKPNNLMCSACLSVDRTLHNISEDVQLKEYYLDILDEVPLSSQHTSITKISLNLCLECKSLLQKSRAFSEQVKRSYHILQKQKCQYYVEIAAPLEENGCFNIKEGFLMKNEVKNEDDDLQGEMNSLDSDISDNYDRDNIEDPKSIEKELETIMKTIEKQDKKNTLKSKVKRTNKIVKKLKLDKPKRVKENANIIPIWLTYEQMLDERQKETDRDVFVHSNYKCATCIIVFSCEKSYKSHLRAKHSPDLGDYICPICETIISSVDSFTAHYKRHLRRYECSICKKRTLDKKVIQQHFIKKHKGVQKDYTCNICGKISNSIDTHRYHKDTHKARVQCPECDKTFRHRAGLMNHRLVVHEYKNAFPCTLCEKVFRWKTSLKRHLEKHELKSKSNTTIARCDTCEVTFSSVCSYQRHLKNSLKHVTQDQLKYICDHCNKRFADKTKLRDHIEEKHLHKTYQCQICMKPSKNRVGLDQHIRNVHRGRPNDKICHYCGKGFPTHLQLESHIRTHTGERPFICEFCPTTFSQQSNLYKHNRQVHMNIKSKRYSLCKKKKDDKTDNSIVPTIVNAFTLDPYRQNMIGYSPERFVM